LKFLNHKSVMAKLYSRLITPNALTAYEGFFKFIAKRQNSKSSVKFIFALNFCYLKLLA